MKAMQLNQYGDDAVFHAEELPRPSVKAGHVLVRLAATSVNTVDTMIRSMGKDLPLSPDLPAVLGMDFAGTVEEVGEGVSEFNPGDEVYGCAGGLADLQGALAEYMLADARLIAHKPKSLSMREAAALPLVGITAYEGLQRAGAKAGQKILVHGGAGGVGHIAVQLARHFGADVYATGSGKQQMKVINEFDATAIDFKTEKVCRWRQFKQFVCSGRTEWTSRNNGVLARAGSDTGALQRPLATRRIHVDPDVVRPQTRNPWSDTCGVGQNRRCRRIAATARCNAVRARRCRQSIRSPRQWTSHRQGRR